MIYKQLIILFFVTFFLVGCQSPDRWVADEDVVLVEVDGRPISLPMLEFMMENRGVGETDHAAMRELLDELIRLSVVANAAEVEGLANRPKLRAQRAIRDMEALQIAYFTEIYERYPVTDAQIEETYRRQIQRSGSQQFRLKTAYYDQQSEALLAIVAISESGGGFDDLGADLVPTQPAVLTPWIDRSQLSERLWDELASAQLGHTLSLPLPAPDGQGWLVAQVEQVRPLQAPALDEVREGITRSLVRQRLEALVDDLYEMAEIVPMLEMEPQTQ